jgi:excisionase family DNA binding protein
VPRPPTNQDWISLSEASRVLGVSPATLRRWSDAGRLRVFTTPGGHRRFSRSSLERLLPADRSRRPSIGAGGVTATRIERAYRNVRREVAPDLPWVLTLSEEHRLLFRERGQMMAESLLQFLDAAQPETAQHLFGEAMAAADEYGAVAAGLGLSLSQTVEGFLRFRAPFHRELALAARRRGFDTPEMTDLLGAAERAMDQLLVATMRGHSRASDDQAPASPGVTTPVS